MRAKINLQAASPFAKVASTKVWGQDRDGDRYIFECPVTGGVFYNREDVEPETYQDYYPYLKGFDRERFEWELSIRSRNFRQQLQQMQTFVEGRRLVDIGSGPGYFVKFASNAGWQASGIEASEEAKYHGRLQFNVDYTDMNAIAEGSVDAITCHHVLEHIIEPMEFVDRIHQKLKPGGLLAIHVPHQQPLSFMLRDVLQQKLSGGRAKTFCTLYDNIHISGFSPASLAKFVESRHFGTYFTCTAGMWTKYYDPFFLGNYLREKKYVQIVRKGVRQAFERLGEPLGRGDWTIGYFYKR